MRLIKKDSILYHALLSAYDFYLLMKQRRDWRKVNSHNLTRACNVFPIEKVKVGKRTYGDITFYYFGGEHEYLNIGSYCSIAGNVKFLGGGEHSVKQLFTFPIVRHIYGENAGEDTKGGIDVGDDVWIGDGVTVLSGVRIGQGAVIGAKSIVTKDVPPYAIWVGNKIIKYRFPDMVVKKLSLLSYEAIDFNKFRDYCDKEITEENVDYIINSIT